MTDQTISPLTLDPHPDCERLSKAELREGAALA